MKFSKSKLLLGIIGFAVIASAAIAHFGKIETYKTKKVVHNEARNVLSDFPPQTDNSVILETDSKFPRDINSEKEVVFADTEEDDFAKVEKIENPPPVKKTLLKDKNSFYSSKTAEEIILSNKIQKLKIITGSLPRAVINEEYFFQFEAVGGKAPYKWEVVWGKIPRGICLDEEAGVLRGTPLKTEVCLFTLRLSDTNGRVTQANFTLVVLNQICSDLAGGQIYIVTKTLPQGAVGKEYYKQIIAGGGAPPYKWSLAGGSILPRNLSLHDGTGVLYGVPQKEGNSKFIVEVKGGGENLARAEFNLSIKKSPLYITTGSLPKAEAGIFYSRQLEAHGGTPPYKWQIVYGSLPEAVEFNSQTAVLSGVPVKAQRDTFRVKVVDADGNYDMAEFFIEVETSPLEITATSLDEGIVGADYYSALSACGGTPPYEWDVLSFLPGGIILNKQSGSFSGTPLEAADLFVNVSVTDAAEEKVSKNLNLVISNTPLVITGPFSFAGKVADKFCQYLSAEGGAPPYTWEIISGDLPDAIMLDKNTGLLSGYFREEITKRVVAKVTDEYDNYASAEISFEITGAAELIILTKTLASIEKDKNYSFYFLAEGGAPPYKWKLKNGSLPRGLNLDAQGLLSGIAKEGGNFKFEIAVEDLNDTQVFCEYVLRVNDNSFFITNESLPEGTAGVEYNFQLEASGGEAPYNWKIAAGGLPQGISLNEKTGLLKGIPLIGQMISVKIECEDTRAMTAEKTFFIKICGEPLNFITARLAPGTMGEAYKQQLEAEGGICPYNWKVSSGKLPEGLSLNNQTGLISGIPLEEKEDSLEIEVCDADNAFRRAIFNLEIKKIIKPLNIITSDLPPARTEKYYEVKFEGEGGQPPYKWNLINDSVLPEGLIFDEENFCIYGAPKAAGNFPVRIQLKDDTDETVFKEFTLSVKELPSSVENFIAHAGDGKIGLAWQNPQEESFASVKIFRSTQGFIDEPEEEKLIYTGTGDNIVDEGLSNGITYYYSVFAFDSEGVFSDFSEDICVAAEPRAVSLWGEADPFADEVVSFDPLEEGGFGAGNLPGVVLGAPRGAGANFGSTDTVSLHSKINDGQAARCGGSITLKFENNIVVDDDGVDFTVFENAFFMGGNPETRWMEPAVVAVSQDGETFYEFEIDFVPHYKEDEIDCYNPYCYSKGFAGINPVYSNNGAPVSTDPAVSGGDSFDLNDIKVKDLKWISFVRVTAAGDNWITDCNGDKVRHNTDMWGCGGGGSSGFDLDAVCAINY